jgi:polysaccharide export outer membrane protein
MRPARGVGLPFRLSQRKKNNSPWFSIGLVFAVGSILAGCALPAAAPTSLELESSVGGADFPYHLVRVNARVVSLLQGHKGVSFGAGFRTAKYAANNALRPGDIVALSVYETGGSTLFPPPSNLPNINVNQNAPNSAPASNSTIPPQIVETDGTINVPFVGRVNVVGKTPGQIGRLIEQQLRGKAVDPQVIVTLVNNTSNTATVGGDVGSPRPVPLSLRGERLLDVIAAAGGAKYQAYETYVDVVRGGHTGTALLQEVVRNPTQNIIIRPNDQVFLTRVPRSFAVMGATIKVAQYPFETERVTLAEAIARAGGPIDQVGDPGGVYLFRFEPWPLAKEILRAANVDVVSDEGAPEYMPILYHVGLKEAEGYFYASGIQIRDKDIVLVTNAEMTQVQKLLNIARGISGIGYDVQRLRTLP